MRSGLVIRRELVVLLVLVLAACQYLPGGYQLPTVEQTYQAGDSPDRPVVSVPDVAPPGFAPAPGKGDLSAYFAQELSWRDCGRLRCATFLAPLDWHDPARQAITIALRMRPATSKPNLGPLFVNPGGPGGSAQEFVTDFAADGLAGFDIIGLDSRGSGESTPVVCGDGQQTDAYFAVDATPDDQSEQAALIAAQQRFNQQCRAASGPLLDHITSIETSYDYDLARHLLGAAKLNFYGVSYGTFLGAVYGELYPNRVGRLVLDSSVDPALDSDVIQAQGFDLSMRNFASWCAQNGCRLGNDAQQVIDTVVGFLKGLDANPLPGDDTRQLTQTLAVSGLIVHFYYGADVYDYLADLLEYTIDSGDGAPLLEAADALNDRLPDGSYGELAYAFPAIRCADEADRGVEDAIEQWHGRDSELAPIFGPLFGPDLVCPLWTVKPAPQIQFTGAGLPPVLIVQNTGDSATPFRNAELMAAQLPSSVLVAREAAGHGAYAAGSECLDEIVVSYLTSGTMPPAGTRCTDG